MKVAQKILIVDEKKDNLLSLELTLEKLGAEIIQTIDCKEALIASLNKDFALAFIDIQMPGVSGYDAGAVDFIDKPIPPPFTARQGQCVLQLDQQKRLLNTAEDKLTEAHNTLEARLLEKTADLNLAIEKEKLLKTVDSVLKAS